ncbi:MAG: hypothetical protein AOA66_1244 [Candidatus Bathyarchaeota archaeon BA2]|nr:MAG: hypothetical protein AOA66_1244 [Candidatus Bathyarchaeota archaeon BA2]
MTLEEMVSKYIRNTERGFDEIKFASSASIEEGNVKGVVETNLVFRERLPSVQLVRGVITPVPFKDNCFDTIISVSAIHYTMKSDIIRTIEF